MSFVVNLVLFAAVKNFANRSRIDKVIAMVRVAPFFLNHGVHYCAPFTRKNLEFLSSHP